MAIRVFDDLEKLINEISNTKVKKESVTERMEKIISNFEQLTKKSTVFQRKMIDVLYCLFNPFGLDEKPLLFNGKNQDKLKLPKWVEVSKESLNEILNIIIKVKTLG